MRASSRPPIPPPACRGSTYTARTSPRASVAAANPTTSAPRTATITVDERSSSTYNPDPCVVHRRSSSGR
jgi:hypothetical protein